MKIAIIGSWKEKNREAWKLRDKEMFSVACTDLGKEIARTGHSLLVTSDAKDSSDYFAVNGFNDLLGSSVVSCPRIHVHRLAGSPPAFIELKEKNPSLFNFIEEKQPNWISNMLIMIRDADIIIAIGGGDKSYQACFAALIANKKLIPIGSFGGAAQKLLHVVRDTRRSHNNIDVTGLENSWDSTVLRYVVKQSDMEEFPRIFIVHGSSEDWEDLKACLLRDLGVPEPFVLQLIFGESNPLPQKFEEWASKSHGSIILATPDDVGGRIVSSTGEVIEKNYRARQNVWLEVGWFWARLGRGHLMILVRGKIEQPSDLQGIEYYQYVDKPSEKMDKIDSFIKILKDKSNKLH